MPVAAVTAVIITYNSRRHLSDIADALSSGSLRPLRSLVVDNASSDGTPAAAAKLGFEVVRCDENAGFGAGCNRGLELTATDFVLFCNPDVRPGTDALERLADALARNRSAAIAGPAMATPPLARRFSRITSTIWGLAPGWMQRHTMALAYHEPVDTRATSVVVDYAEGALMLCRVDALRTVGGFDEQFFLYSEEEDLSRRLRDYGWQTLLVPFAHAAHAHSSSSADIDSAAMAPFRFHSQYRYYRKHTSRLYAEWARFLFAACILVDQAYRKMTAKPQVHANTTALALFRSSEALRRAHATRHLRLRNTSAS